MIRSRVAMVAFAAAAFMSQAAATGVHSPRAERPPADAARVGSREISLDDFTTQVFHWTNPDDRPILLLSKGTLLAWLPDPILFRGGTDPAWYYRSGHRSLLIVPPGEFMLAFPPWSHPDDSPTQAARVQDKTYWLAVTQDGLWGLLDHSKTRLYLDEHDLRKYVVSDPSPGVGYGMTVESSVELALKGAALTRGDTFRIRSVNDDGTTTIDFDSKLKDITDKRRDIEAVATGSAGSPDMTFTIPSETVAQIDLSGVVDAAILEAWRNGQSPNLDYRNQVFRHFGNVRVPGDTRLQFGCGDKLAITTTNTSDASIDATAAVKAAGGFLQWFDAHFALSVNAKRSFERVEQGNYSEVSTTRRRLSLVDYLAPDGEDGSFFAGVAQTCQSPRTWTTLIVRKEDDDYPLHQEFAELGPDGKEPAVPVRPTEAKLEAIRPGGSPFNVFRGRVEPRCFRQEMRFEAIAQKEIGDRLEAKVAIALATAPDLGTVNLQAFFADQSCQAGPS